MIDTLLATIAVSEFNDKRVYFRNSSLKGLIKTSGTPFTVSRGEVTTLTQGTLQTKRWPDGLCQIFVSVRASHGSICGFLVLCLYVFLR